MDPDLKWKDTFTALYREHSATVYTRCYWALSGDRSAAEDATQATFVVAMNRLRNGGPEIRSMRAWLLTVAHSQALEQMRRPEEVLAAEPDPRLADAFVNTESAALQAVSPHEALTLLTAAMPALEPENRRILSLHLQEERGELTRKDVNDVLEHELGMRPGAVKKRIFELRKKDGILSQALVMVMLLPTRRRDCAELADLVDKNTAGVDPRLRKTVAAHIRACGQCEARSRGIAALVHGVASAAPILPAPPEVWQRLREDWDEPVQPTSGTSAAPSNERPRFSAGNAKWVVAAAVIAVILVLIVGLPLVGSREAGSASRAVPNVLDSTASPLRHSPPPSSGQSARPPAPSTSTETTDVVEGALPRPSVAEESSDSAEEPVPGPSFTARAEDPIGPEAATAAAESGPSPGTSASAATGTESPVAQPPPVAPTSPPTRSAVPVITPVVITLQTDGRDGYSKREPGGQISCPSHPNLPSLASGSCVVVFSVEVNPAAGWSEPEARVYVDKALRWSIYPADYSRPEQSLEGLKATSDLRPYVGHNIVVEAELAGSVPGQDQDGFFVTTYPWFRIPG